MKITESQLRQIITEELDQLMYEQDLDWSRAYDPPDISDMYQSTSPPRPRVPGTSATRPITPPPRTTRPAQPLVGKTRPAGPGPSFVRTQPYLGVAGETHPITPASTTRNLVGQTHPATPAAPRSAPRPGLGRSIARGAKLGAAGIAGDVIGSTVAPYVLSPLTYIPGVGEEGGLTPQEVSAKYEQGATALGQTAGKAYDLATSYIPGTEAHQRATSRANIDRYLQGASMGQQAIKKNT